MSIISITEDSIILDSSDRAELLENLTIPAGVQEISNPHGTEFPQQIKELDENNWPIAEIPFRTSANDPKKLEIYTASGLTNANLIIYYP